MKKSLTVAILLAVSLALIAQPALAAGGIEPEIEQRIITEDGGGAVCTCGGVNKLERWILGYKVYISAETLSWAHTTGLASGITTLVAGLISIFAAPAALAEVLMLVGVYLISGGSLAYIGAMSENGIIIYHCYFLPYPIYVKAQDACSYPHGGGGGGGGFYAFQTDNGIVS